MSAVKGEHHMIPLSLLLKRELASEKTERPEITSGQANQSKKGEDFTLIKSEYQRVLGDGVTTYSVFGIFDGHNGSAAAIYTKENLLNNVLRAIPTELNRDEWISVLPRALVAGFVKTDKDFQEKVQSSGTTVTFVIVEGSVITVASVGDSRCILESADGGLYYLSADHRLECSEEERDRVTASGGEVGRLNAGGGAQIGPLRCWPGGLCLSRSIGDVDVGEFIVPVPYVKQVKEAVGFKGLRDDTTCIVVDMLPPEKTQSHAKRTGKKVLKSMFRRKSSGCPPQVYGVYLEAQADVVEEMVEEGSAFLSERLDTKYPLCNLFKLFSCAVCQKGMKPGEGISVHLGTCKFNKARPWDGPFLCLSCHKKREAMEGKST